MITIDALEPVYGPLPIAAEVVHYSGTLLIGRDMARWPAMFQTEADAVRYNMQMALRQVEHSAAEAPEQVEHWLWVAESYRRDLVGDASPADVPFAERCADCREADWEDWAKETGPCPVCGHDGR